MLKYPLPLRLAPLLVFALCATTACGSAEPSTHGGSPTTVTAIVPGSRAGIVPPVEAVDYAFDCGPGPTPESRPTFERVGGLLNPSFDQTEFWKGTLDYPPGDCELLVIGRDSDGEALCIARQQLAAGEPPPRELYLEMVCGFCFCQPAGDVTLTVETLTAPAGEPAAGVTYAFACNDEVQTAVPESLRPIGTGAIELNGQAAATEVWEDTLANLAAGTCDFEISALDKEGASLCSVTASISVAPDTVNSIHLVLPCGGER